MGVRGRVVSRVDSVDPWLERLEAPPNGIEPARLYRQELRRDDERAGPEPLLEERHQPGHPAGSRLSRLRSRLRQEDVPQRRLSTGGCTSANRALNGSFRERSYALSHTQRIPGYTSQPPSGRTPPHGPLRSCFGQFIGHVIPVVCKTHWPHIVQPQTGPLSACSSWTSTQATAAARLRSIRSFASRTAVEASAA